MSSKEQQSSELGFNNWDNPEKCTVNIITVDNQKEQPTPSETAEAKVLTDLLTSLSNLPEDQLEAFSHGGDVNCVIAITPEFLLNIVRSDYLKNSSNKDLVDKDQPIIESQKPPKEKKTFIKSVKKAIAGGLVAATLSGGVLPGVSQAIENPTTIVDTTIKMDTASVIKNNRTFLPGRATVDALGGTVDWNADTKDITFTKDGKTIVFQSSKKDATYDIMIINGVVKQNDVYPFVNSDNRLEVPVRIVAETLGSTVLYDKYATNAVSIIDSKNNIALSLAIGGKEIKKYNLTNHPELLTTQEQVDAKNVVVDNLNYALKNLILSEKIINPLGINTAEVETYKQTGSSEGLSTFQVLNYINANGNEVPGFVMVTGTYGFKNHISDMEYAVDWLNKVDPTMLRSFVGTTKFIATDIADNYAKTYFELFPTYAGNYNPDFKYVLINDGTMANDFRIPYIFFTYLFLAESKAIQLAMEGKTIKEQGMGKGQFILDWANKEYAAGKITQQEYGNLDGQAKGIIAYYSKLS